MKETLPSAIQGYFAGKNARDFAMAVAGFSASAVVKDEDRDHQGPGAIRTWIEETAAKYDDRAEVRAVSSSGDNVEVTANITGKFPGSPILLRFKFILDDGQISRLEIAP
jgi:SnoaL-like domain